MAVENVFYVFTEVAFDKNVFFDNLDAALNLYE